MDSGKLVTADDEFDVYICDECGEHEAQISVLNGMVCFQCWLSRNECFDAIEGNSGEIDWRQFSIKDECL